MTSVLVVDDSITVRRGLREIFKEAGFDLATSGSGADARRAARAQSFDLFVLDLNLPDESGLVLLRDLRASPATAKRPVVVISGESALQYRVESLRAGASDYIGKPYSAQYVVRRANDLVSSRHGARRPADGPGRVLIVDDSATYSNALADELRRDGHDIILASSGQGGLELLSLQPAVDWIVLDFFLPDLNGMEVCRRLRESPASRDVPVLMLTGRRESVLTEDALAAGVNDLAAKSQDLSGLRAKLRDLAPKSSRRYTHAEAAAPGARLLDRVVAVSGMSEVLGRASIERACGRAGVDPQTMTPADLRLALPDIERTLGFFLPPSQAAACMQAIAALAQGSG
jgi:DNA-binding response OmpR family regulator